MGLFDFLRKAVTIVDTKKKGSTWEGEGTKIVTDNKKKTVFIDTGKGGSVRVSKAPYKKKK